MTTSASGVRIQGDDYQHLFAWYHALRALDPAQDVTAIAVEAKGAGNVDDLVVRHAGGGDEFYQVKYSVDASHPIDARWWITPATAGGTSPLQKFWQSWQKLRRGGALPRFGLYTNRPLDVNDPLLKLRDGRLGRLGPRLRNAGPRSDARKKLQEWAKHAGATTADLLDMLDSLDLLMDQGPWSHLVASTADRMAALGLKSDELAVEQGVSAIRSWVTQGKTEVPRSEIAAEIDRRNLRNGPRRATLIVQAVDHYPWAEAATAALDWVDLFEGNEPRARRKLRDPALWNGRLWPDLAAAERTIRSMGFDRVLVRGYMRLPVWFAAGAQLADTRRFHVMMDQRGELWSSEVRAAEVALVVMPTEVGAGPDIALGLSVTNDLSADVLAYVRQANLPVGRFVHVALPAMGPAAVAGAAEAMGWALRVREVARQAARETGATRAHLFLSGPAGCALFLGHVWNRVPTTLVYEDVNPGYTPTFLVQG